MKHTIDLCGKWRTLSDGDTSPEQPAHADVGTDDSAWREVSLPSTFEAIAPGYDCYTGCVWYRRTVEIPAEWAHRFVVICFEGANYHTRVYMNGTMVGENTTGFLPFEIAVHKYLRFGQRNNITIRIDARSLEGENPGRLIGWRNYGGILRPFRLEARNHTHMTAVRITAIPAAGGGQLAVEADLSQPHTGHAQIALFDAQGSELATCRVQLSNEQLLRVPSLDIPEAQPWSPQHPVLYQLRLTLCSDAGNDTIDSRKLRIGFRSIAARDGKLLLNGEAVYLTGFNRHEDSPTTNMAGDLRTVLQDLRQMKAAGANFVRLCHYPHDPRELDLCDELGLLVMDEIPLYWLASENQGVYQSKLQQATDQLDRMIARDRNHPSVVFWSVSNETQEEQPLVKEANELLLHRARAADPTRLIVHVSHKWQQCPGNFGEDDVICVNSYPNVWSSRLPDKVQDAAGIWCEALKRVHERNPGKPILITEFGHPGIDGDPTGKWGTLRQADAIDAEFAAFDAPWVCGAVIWCWADHAWSPREFMDGLSVSPFGVVTRSRQPKPALAEIASLFRQKQGMPDDRPMTMPENPNDVIMTADHSAPIPSAALPNGYQFAPITPDSAALWADIWRDADATIDIAPDVFQKEFGTDWQIIAERCFLVLDPRGRAVATISAWFDRRGGGADIGRIHWVAVRRQWQGVGLARPMMSHAMDILCRRHTESYLVTRAFRIPAIALYLGCGFVPCITDDRSRRLWAHVSTRLHHPAIEAALRR